MMITAGEYKKCMVLAVKFAAGGAYKWVLSDLKGKLQSSAGQPVE
jgi:hypothetical protein